MLLLLTKGSGLLLLLLGLLWGKPTKGARSPKSATKCRGCRGLGLRGCAKPSKPRILGLLLRLCSKPTKAIRCATTKVKSHVLIGGRWDQ